MRKWRYALAAAALAVGLAVGCTETAGQRTIGFTVMDLSNPFFVACEEGARAVVEGRGDALQVRNGDSSASTQLRSIEDFIQRRVACILLNPVNSDAAGAAVKKANAADIPVVTFDVNASSGDVACFVESNNVLAGRLCADYIGWRLQGKGRVVVIDHPGVTSVIQRTDGFKARLAEKYPDVEIVKTLVGEGKRGPSMKVTEHILGGDVEFDAIFAINDPTGLGATKALKDAGESDIFVAAIDGAPDAVAELESGDSPFAMSVAQFPNEIARTAAEMGYKLLDGETVPEHIKVPVMPVTRDNLEQYPGWSGTLPAQVEVPWETDLTVTRESE
ncbi:MAG: substrate-binding domain-containing protein [Planctomycetota bacterium]